MSYENVKFAKSNFCLFPRPDEFGSINHTTSQFLIRDSDPTPPADPLRIYALSSGVSEIVSMEYVGPRDLVLNYNQLGDKLPIFTLEHISADNCLIKKWYIDEVGVSELTLHQTISLTSSGSYRFNCYAMAVENYEIEFAAATTTGTGFIQVSSVSGIDIGDVLLLGPSGDVDNLYAFEHVTVTGVVGSNVYITTSVSGAIAPTNEYASGDLITFCKDIYLFSDTGQNGDTSKGSIYKIHSVSGTVLSVEDSGIYAGVRAAAWSRDYEAPGFIPSDGVNLLYLNKSTHQIQRSQVMTNFYPDGCEVFPVYELIFDNGSIYRLQANTIRFDNGGGYSLGSWSDYNYQSDSISPYTRSVEINPHPAGVIRNDGILTFTGIVRDQFGIALGGKNIKFTVNDVTLGDFSPISGETTTDADGEFSMIFDFDYFWPTDPDDDVVDALFKVRSDGSSVTSYGSVYVFDEFTASFRKRFRIEAGNVLDNEDGFIKQLPLDIDMFTFVTQISGVQSWRALTQWLKFQFPGGHWQGTNPPITDLIAKVRQFKTLDSNFWLDQISSNFDSDASLDQFKEKTDTGQISQLYVSRHVTSGHKDTVVINQFKFVDEINPDMWSEKNPVDTDIYIKLRPFAFDLNQSTLVFKVREVWYGGDTGYVDVTSSCVVEYNPLDGTIRVTYNPPVNFHHKAIVYVSIEVYDTAPTPNIILTDYWFKIIADYRAPYIENESPASEEEEVPVSTDISFDVFDAGEGVDISSLSMYVNNRLVNPTVSVISGGYHILYDPPKDFYYGESVSIAVTVYDIGENLLYDSWKFYCAGSTGPWIDRDSFYPRNCSKGVYRKITGLSVNVYAVDETGVDSDSILVTIGGKNRDVTITPIVYRID